MSDIKYIKLPLDDAAARDLRAGDVVRLSGKILIARDAAHKRIAETITRGEKLPFSIDNQVIYYAGPAPTPKGAVIGAIGPTTSGRMDPYTPLLLENGLRAMIGKGKRSPEVLAAIKEHNAVYFGATGGTAVLLADAVKNAEDVAYADLGPEAVRLLTVEEMPLTVIADCHGGNIYESGPAEARKIMGSI
ncbi:MAG: FumA C-terminus/TtdB family hydratase beta subunit [Synergistes sp.]|nr:FumA C-terminus/TtdB family hydratase beta subunit [Synergistes sp.]